MAPAGGESHATSTNLRQFRSTLILLPVDSGQLLSTRSQYSQSRSEQRASRYRARLSGEGDRGHIIGWDDQPLQAGVVTRRPWAGTTCRRRQKKSSPLCANNSTARTKNRLTDCASSQPAAATSSMARSTRRLPMEPQGTSGPSRDYGVPQLSSEIRQADLQ